MEDEFNKLKNMLKNTERPTLSNEQKKSLWSRIVYSYRTIQAKKNMPNSNTSFIRIFSYTRQFVAMALVILVLASSGITIALADTSKPGDFLFPVDRAAENVRIAIASNKKKDELRVKFSQERVEEIRILLASTEFDDVVDEDTSEDKQNVVATESVVMDTVSTSSSEDIASEEVEEGNSNTEGSFVSIESERVQKAEDGLTFALDYIRTQQGRLEANGNSEAALILEGILGELFSLADDHVDTLEKVQIKITNKNDSSKINIAASTDKIKTRFKFEESGNDKLSIQFESFPTRKKDDDQSDNGDDDEDEDDKKENKGKRKTIICHKGKSIRISVSALRSHIKNHGDKIGRCSDNDDNHDDDGDDDDDDTDTQAPVISDIDIEKTTTTAKISWDTNEDTIGVMWISTETPVNTNSARSKESSAGFNKNHTIDITGLSASTTYYVIIVAEDESNNRTQSIEQTFTTDAIVVIDTQAPIISNLTANASTTDVYPSRGQQMKMRGPGLGLDQQHQ